VRTLAFVNGRVLLPKGIRDDIVVVVDGTRITELTTTAPAHAERVDLEGGVLLPGFIDTQVNGGGGLLLNEAPTVETVATMAEAHRAYGTTGMLPTIISDDFDVIAAAIQATDEAIEVGIPGILGRHIEGPFLNVQRRGIHSAQRIRRIDPQAIALLGSARHGRTLVTLAPECVEPGDIAALVAAGVLVAAGHSDADYDTVQDAIAEGMTGVTHLFNAMSQLTNRAPGLVGAALDSPQLFAGIIVDGYHVHPAAIRLALAVKGAARMMLVTDAMSLTGVDADRFMLQHTEIRRVDGRLTDKTGTLAGSALDMVSAVRMSMSQLSVSLHQAVTMAATTPSTFLGLGGIIGTIAPGFRADLVLVDEAVTAVRGVWINGREYLCPQPCPTPT
jgi:N-acetylglucosamine-6-phosphate deacetylase